MSVACNQCKNFYERSEQREYYKNSYVFWTRPHEGPYCRTKKIKRISIYKPAFNPITGIQPEDEVNVSYGGDYKELNKDGNCPYFEPIPPAPEPEKKWYQKLW